MITIERNRRGEDSEKRQDGGHGETPDKHIQINTLAVPLCFTLVSGAAGTFTRECIPIQCNTVAEKPAGLAAFTVFWKVLFC